MVMEREEGSNGRGLGWGSLGIAAIGVAGVAGLAMASARMRRMEMYGRVVLITGGSRGLGLLLAKQFAEAGARVGICARDADEVARAGELASSHGCVRGYICDVTEPDSVQGFVQAAREELGPIDVLVNNAGIMVVGPRETMTAEDYREALATHFWGPYFATEAVLPEMRRRRMGRIVNIASIGGRVSVPHMLPYCVSKFALVGFSQGLAAELSGSGVRVTTVCPGVMRTGSAVHARFKGRHRSEYRWFSLGASTPLVSIDADRAARLIVDACEKGQRHLTLGIAARAAEIATGVMPSKAGSLIGVVDRLLPSPGGIGTESRAGRDSGSLLTPSILTHLNDAAARRNNEVGAR